LVAAAIVLTGLTASIASQGQLGGTVRKLSEGYFEKDGRVFAFQIGGTAPVWTEVSAADLPPVALTDLVSLSYGFAVTSSGEGWFRAEDLTWNSMGNMSGSVPTTRSTWGAVKERFK